MILRLFSLLPLALALAGCVASDAARAPAEARQVVAEGRFEIEGRAGQGAYGVRVHLLLHRRGGGWERALDGPDRQQATVGPDGAFRGWERALDGPDRQQATVGPDGAFRIALATAADLSAFDSVAVAPATESEAIRLLRADAVRAGDGPVLWRSAVRRPLPPSGDVVLAGIAGAVPRPVGVAVRTATIAREFVHRLYDGAPPFALPRVDVELSGGGGYVFQTIDPDAPWGHEIEVRAAGVTPALMAHEYGHYVSYRMWGADAVRYALRNRQLREGWAIFFSFAARAYAAAQYGDQDLAPSNPERAPFTDRIDADVRYDRISYGVSHPDYPAIGALLWSLYDRAAPSPFEPEGPSAGSLAGDNDDISGGVAVFEAVRTARAHVFDEAGVLEVVAAFRAAHPGLGESIGGALAFFLCPAAPDCDVKAPASDDPRTASLTLRPVSPANLVARRVPGGVALTWVPRTYAAPWANRPEAVHVYRDGVRVAVLAGTASGWLDAGASGGTYEVRAVGGGGESAGGAMARVE
ncbi:hypothetical protein [Rubrivirga sp. IMCC45206]|uniref:hypothetical protein n=1 Tax=Rubrivirga sp. IMCC45206 TaxID=3391614 RepID=UPI00398FC45E